MSHKIFITILNRKIENFVSTFIEDSKSIFFDNTKLIHPGEYGRYRENSLKDLLSMITSYKIGEGFIITSKENTSTQCDVIIFDNSDTVILENNFTQIITIESVISIGEVKSTLNKTNLKKALRKLAENKKLQRDINFNFNEQCLQENYYPITFLVCKDLSFDYKKIDFNEIYEGIKREFWHDSILMVDQGVFTNNFNFNNLIENDRKTYIDKGYNVNSNVDLPRTCNTIFKNYYASTPKLELIDNEKKYNHIKTFLAGLSAAISNKKSFKTPLLNYSDLDIADIIN